MPTNGEGKHRLLPPMDSPPPKRYKSESLPSSDAGRSRYHLSQSAQPSERGRSRQTSTAMDIYSITNKDPVERERRDNRWYSSNGSVASHPSQPSSHSPRALTPGRKYPERYPCYSENGRTYHGYRKGTYLLPCDDEEQDRLDIFHKLFTVARVSDGLIYAPHPPSSRILDLGCGTGIWSIEVAQKYPESFVVGVDLAPIQPQNHPKNCDFYAPFDFESPWALGEDSWDLIHMQMGSGSIVSWPSLYRRIFSHLRPGAWFEQVEIDFEPRCDDRSLSGLALRHWYQSLKHATESTSRPIVHSSRETIRNLQEAGFTEIDHQMVGLPLNPWHQDEHERKVARWYNLAISESIEPLSLAPFSRVYKWPVDKIQRLAADVKSEAFNKDLHCYNILHIYQARKPAATATATAATTVTVTTN
ncbi:Secondary metabolism regulator laeA [Penicillium riverlandense]|uniref:Secondary metabolism regulator laeA n=1 Tax=Penicillium riverlandense TaxID=1903569 RepID=UPI00254987BB|nr:Secondary metabolism regulator laeA [Penicillium riverlandense]KAJ5819316.1 Secondary metabolism regulator laeA [Penicillium riverlandense]